MIAISTGKPGAGKSYGALCAIIDELQFGDRDIVTNVSLHMAELNAYFQRSGRNFVDVFARVRLITREQAREFWRFRGRLTMRPDRVDRKGELVGETAASALGETVEGQPGVFYVIDEAHILFDARNWQKSADSLTFYNSQHRKLGDELLFVTQFLKLIEMRVRGFAERFYVFRNFAGAKAMQILSMPVRIRELVYSVEPGGTGVRHDTEAWRRLDLEKAKCYDTTAGVGMTGGRKPEVRKTRGFSVPWWTVLVAIVLGGVGVAMLPNFFAKKILTGFSSLGTHVVPVAHSVPAEPPSVADRVERPHNVVAVAPAPVVPLPPVYFTGSLVRGARAVAYLSSGRVLRSGVDLALITSDKCVSTDGETFWRSTVVRGPASHRETPVSPRRDSLSGVERALPVRQSLFATGGDSLSVPETPLPAPSKPSFANTYKLP